MRKKISTTKRKYYVEINDVEKINLTEEGKKIGINVIKCIEIINNILKP